MISSDITVAELNGKLVTLDIAVLWETTACPNPDIYKGMKGIIHGKVTNVLSPGELNVTMENGNELELKRGEMNLV